MKNNDISRTEAQFALDEILQQHANGQTVSLSQIQAADAAFTDAARRENVADLEARLDRLNAGFDAFAAQRKKAHQAMRECLHKQDELKALAAKINAYLDEINLKISVAAVEESEVLSLLEQA